jgi:putative effector of murein hydrolase LrgA (UPF0299 family)
MGARLALAFVPIVVGVVVYALACALLQIDEVKHYARRLWRR